MTENKDLLWDKFASWLLSEGMTERRRHKLFSMYGTCKRRLDYEKAGREEIEAFLNDLNANRFKKENGKPYSGSTKADIKKFLKQFYKWYKGKAEFYPQEVSWIKARVAKDEKPEEKPVISKEEAEKLASSFMRNELRILTLMLFDAGFRIEEMLSARKRDLTWEEFDAGQKCFWIACNKSKTIVRKVPISLFSDDIKAFCRSAYYTQLGDDDLLFKIDYDNYRRFLRIHSLKLFKKKLTPHALRHSSATYYAREYDGNMNMIADRYGWSYSSNELKTYIRRSGAYQKAGVKKTYTNDVIKLSERVTELEEELAKMRKDVFAYLEKSGIIADIKAKAAKKK